MTSGLHSQEIAVADKPYRPQKQPSGPAKSFWLMALVKRIRSALHALAPIGYQDENGFYFGEQPAGQRTRAREQVDMTK